MRCLTHCELFEIALRPRPTRRDHRAIQAPATTVLFGTVRAQYSVAELNPPEVIVITYVIIYASGEGQTERIAEHIRDHIAESGARVYCLDVSDARKDNPLPGADAVILASSIHMGEHSLAMRRWVRRNAAELSAIPSAFLSVSLTAARHDAEAEQVAAGYIEAFVEDTGWAPHLVASVAGALPFTRYGIIKRKLMTKIAEASGFGDIDPTHDYEYTDWEQVDDITDSLARITRELDTAA